MYIILTKDNYEMKLAAGVPFLYKVQVKFRKLDEVTLGLTR